ncbi:MAG: hypothetical protein ACHQU8_07880 [Gemmatimonadales bacterium]
MSVRWLVPGVCGLLSLPISLRAQCPDGTPPPCARGTPRPAALGANSVAVLYFDNLSRDTADAYLADGLAEELIVRLSQVRRLDVKSRFESQRVRGHTAGDPKVLGRSLRAAYLVTGSMQQAGQQVRLRVSLVRTADGANMWGDVYDRSGGNILQIQSDIAREVAGAITGQLLPTEQASLARHSTEDPVAYQLYLRAVGAANTTSEAGLRSALDLLDRAIARDSGFADAWAKKAFVWTWLADGYEEGRVAYPQARAAAERALGLDSSRALAWSLLSQSIIALDMDFARAQPMLQRALALDPRQPDAHLVVSAARMVAGDMDESIAEARRGWEGDTLSASSATVYLWTLLVAQRADLFGPALARARVGFSVEEYRTFDAVDRLLRGDAAGALEGLTWQFYGGEFASIRARALLALGRPEAARAMADSMVASAERRYFDAYGIAETYGEIGDVDRAFSWLDRAVDQRTMWLIAVRQDHAFAAMRVDPRWAALMRRLEHP